MVAGEGLLSFLRRLKRTEDVYGERPTFTEYIMSTHPSTEKRIARLEKTVVNCRKVCRLYPLTDIGIRSTGCVYLLHFCGKVIVITDDMTADKRIAKKLFFRKYFLLSACFIRSSYKARYTLSVSAGKAVSGMATEKDYLRAFARFT